MKFAIGLFIFFIFSNCTFYDNYEDFDERKKIGKTVFKENMQECEELGHLQASSAEGSK